MKARSKNDSKSKSDSRSGTKNNDGSKKTLKKRPCPIRHGDNEAVGMEKELLMHGTWQDKIDLLSLLIERNPTPENYKNLLAFCENQRNDVHYHTLKNITDLMISNKGIDHSYIKQRIIRSFDVNLRNQYIKMKVVRLVYKLLKERILFIDLIHIFINKLGDKKDMSEYVVDKLHLLMPSDEDIILDGIEDFYFKNDLFRSRHVALRFLAHLDCENKRKAFGLFNSILNDFNEGIPEEHRNILLEDLIVGLGKNITDESIDRIDVIKKAIHTEKMIFYGSKVLFGSRDPELLDFLKKAIRSHKMRDSKHLPKFMNLIHESIIRHRDEEFCSFLLNSSFLYTPQYITCVLIMCSKSRKIGLKRFDNIHGLRILTLHHNDVVRRLALQLIKGEIIKEFNSFDHKDFNKIERKCVDLHE